MGDADAQFSCEDFQEHEPLQTIEPRPPAADEGLLGRRIEFAKRKDPLLHPDGQWRIVSVRDRHLIEHEGGRLGAVTNDRIALVQQPFVESVAASVHARIAAEGTSRLRRRPVRKNTAHAASPAGVV